MVEDKGQRDTGLESTLVARGPEDKEKENTGVEDWGLLLILQYIGTNGLKMACMPSCGG